MTIATCPKCNESVRLPSAASQRASVRCPLCLEEFLLAEVFDSLPPMLEVVDDPEAVSAAAGAASAAEPADFGLREPDNALDLAPAFSIDRSGEGAGVATAPSAKRRKVPARPPRKKKSAVAEVVKIVLGGVAGLVIAQLLLWWMPWQDLRRDPFALGPSVAKYAPWLVPVKFHGRLGAGMSSETGTPTAETANLSPSGLPQRTFDDVNVQDLSPPSAVTKGKPASAKKRPTELPPVAVEDDATEPAVDPFAPDPFAPIVELPAVDDSAGLGDDLFELDPAMDLASDLETDPVLDIETDPMPDDSPVQPVPESKPVDADRVHRLSSAAQFDRDDLADVMKQVQPAFEALAIADADEAVKLITQNYRNLTKLAEIVVAAEDLAPQDRQSAAQLLLSLVEKSDVIPMLGRAGTAWADAGDRRTNRGILLVGQVQSVATSGELFRIELLRPDDKIATAYSDTDPSHTFQQGDQVLLVGVVVDQPADHLVGYAGEEQSLIWGPFVRAVPE